MSQDKDLPVYLTLKQASLLLQVHSNTLRSWDKKGVLKAKRIGLKGIMRYKRDDLIKFLEKDK